MTRRSNDPTHESNPTIRVLYKWFFENIQVDQDWVAQVRALAEQGTVVYILRNLNLVDYLALDYLTKRYDLPQIRYVNDLRLGPLNPMGKGGLFSGWLSRATSPSAPNALAAALAAGGSAALFLKRPPSPIDVASGSLRASRGLPESDDHIRTLIELQAGRDKPILLVPQLFIWTSRPDTQGTQLLDFVLGPREWASSLRTAGQLLYNYRHVELRAGEPLDMRAFLQSERDTRQDTQTRRIVYTMLRRLERERRTVTGPAQKPPDRLRHQILRSPKLQETIEHLAGEAPKNQVALRKRSLEMLRSMQAVPDASTIKALEVLLDRVFHRIYAGIDVDQKGIAELREKAKEGSLVLLPSHKSYVDFLLLSYLFNEENLQLPMIAAGDNLSFFPLGPVLRRAGGFFIRRTFRGDKLYSATVEAYVRRLLKDGYTLEVFIEGGRSRTGKLLEPKVGLLSMIVDAALATAGRPVYFVPISIGYERIVETGAYGSEMTGQEKHKEDAAGLLKSTEVLRHRYGRINVQFGQFLTLDDIQSELKQQAGPLTPARRRAIVTRLGNRTMDEINQVTAVTPGALTALALLSDRRRSVSHEELVERCRKFLAVLNRLGARVTPTAATAGELRADAIREAAQMFVDAELLESYDPAYDALTQDRRGNATGRGVFYRIPERKRIELDTSKNIIVHFFVERGLVATAILRDGTLPADAGVVRERVRMLSKLFKHEFRFRADAAFDTIFDDTIATMVELGELRHEDGGLCAGQGHDGWSGLMWLRSYRAMVRNFIEGYRIAARGLTALARGPQSEKDLAKRALAMGNRMFLAGEVEMREAVSKPLVQNAYVVFREDGYIRHIDGKCALTESFDSPEAVAAIEGRIADHLGTPAEPE
jgi:glycerol-3-phosphate O-acyltransferase